MKKEPVPISKEAKLYFKCKTCGKVVFKVAGACQHSRRHGVTLNPKDLLRHFTLLKHPDPKAVETIQKRLQQQAAYRQKRRPQMQNVKCNACGHVVKNATSLYSHCLQKHQQPLREIGYTYTDDPITPSRARHSPPSDLLKLLGNLPKIIRLIDSKPSENGLLVTVEYEIPTESIATLLRS